MFLHIFQILCPWITGQQARFIRFVDNVAAWVVYIGPNDMAML